MRVLNIVSCESRILASRERCPFLVQLEVAETGLEGSDARLYAGGGVDSGKSAMGNGGVGDSGGAEHNLQTEAGFGVSLEEVIRLFASSKQKKYNEANWNEQQQQHPYDMPQKRDDFTSYRIPTELLSRDAMLLSKPNDDPDDTNKEQNTGTMSSSPPSSSSPIEIDSAQSSTPPDVDLPRGGYQRGDDGPYYPNQPGGYGNPGNHYEMNNQEMLRQQELQRLNEQMLYQQNQGVPLQQPHTQNQR